MLLFLYFSNYLQEERQGQRKIEKKVRRSYGV
jgi:hypothetical protein